MNNLIFIQTRLINKILEMAYQLKFRSESLIDTLNKINCNCDHNLMKQINILLKQSVESRNRTIKIIEELKNAMNDLKNEIDPLLFEEIITDWENLKNDYQDFQAIYKDLFISDLLVNQNGKLIQKEENK